MKHCPMHLSIPVSSLAGARRFYGQLLGCAEGRSATDRVDFDFFGNHLVAHLEVTEAEHRTQVVISGGYATPVRHFGVLVDRGVWQDIADRLRSAGTRFALEPQVIFPGEVREQAIFLAEDDCGNFVEFKSQPADRVFARR
jgi:extradiol dioxygenase family protein